MSDGTGGRDPSETTLGKLLLEKVLGFLRGVLRFPKVFISEVRHSLRSQNRCEFCLAVRPANGEPCPVCSDQPFVIASDRIDNQRADSRLRPLLIFGDQISRVLVASNSLLLIAWVALTLPGLIWGIDWGGLSSGSEEGILGLVIEVIGLLSSLFLALLNFMLLSAPSLYLLYRREKLEEEPRVFLLWAVVSIVFVFNFQTFQTGIFQVLALVTVAQSAMLFSYLLARTFSIGVVGSWIESFSRGFLQEEPFGRAGSNLDTAPFDVADTQLGQLGEQTTAIALRERLLGKAVLFNSLRSPDPDNDADIDHAVLFGKTCVLLDSKNWGKANYEVLMGNVLKDGKPFLGGSSSFVDSVAQLRSLLPGHVQCLGFVVITNKSATVKEGSSFGDGVGLIQLETLLEIIDQDASSCVDAPDLATLRLLLSLTPPGPEIRKTPKLPLEDRDLSLLVLSSKIPSRLKRLIKP